MSAQEPNIRILLGDTQYLIKAGLTQLIRENSDLEPAGSVHNLADLQDRLHSEDFDLLIVDKNFGDFFEEENLPLTGEIFKQKYVLAISDMDKEGIYRIHKHHLTGFITYESSKEEILEAIRKSAAGIKFFSPRIVEALIAMTYGPGAAAGMRPGTAAERDRKNVQSEAAALLSDREKEILQLVVKGKTAQEMADDLFLSIHTIYTHRKNILKKLSCKNATELLNFAMNNNLME
ncbi:MAG: response regulator transcription factor [Bacteroidia bacterium]|nr:response regulator transcription factor [Bacteroidia bacterium]